MIAQLKWLKEHAARNDLSLPVDPAKLGTLRYVLLDSLLLRHASSPANADKEIDVPLVRLWKLTYKGQLLLKPAFYPYALRCTDALLVLLRSLPRSQGGAEQGAVKELSDLRNGIAGATLEPPVGAYFPRYPHLGEAFGMERSPLNAIPENKALIRTVCDLIFEGVRPDTWVTPADADRETARYASI